MRIIPPPQNQQGAQPTSTQAVAVSTTSSTTTTIQQEPQRQTTHKKSKTRIPRDDTTTGAAGAPSTKSVHREEGKKEKVEEEEGYNSGDEYSFGSVGSVQIPRDVDEPQYEAALLKKRGFEIRHVGTDGACLFRAVADQVFGDEALHSTVREQCVSFMVSFENIFCP